MRFTPYHTHLKKQFFFKEYLPGGGAETKAIREVATIETEFVQIEQELPAGATIQPDTVLTVIEGQIHWVR